MPIQLKCNDVIAACDKVVECGDSEAMEILDGKEVRIFTTEYRLRHIPEGSDF